MAALGHVLGLLGSRGGRHVCLGASGGQLQFREGWDGAWGLGSLSLSPRTAGGLPIPTPDIPQTWPFLPSPASCDREFLALDACFFLVLGLPSFLLPKPESQGHPAAPCLPQQTSRAPWP